jgi:hypothetical protein
MSHDQTTGQINGKLINIKSFQNVAELKYLVMMATNQNSMYLEMKTE